MFCFVGDNVRASGGVEWRSQLLIVYFIYLNPLVFQLMMGIFDL